MKPTINHIIAEYRYSIFKICLGYSKNVQDAEDLLQETLVNIWRGLESFRNESNIRTWIYRITTNTCLISLCKKSVKMVALEKVSEARYSFYEEPKGLDDSFLALHRSIQELPEKGKVKRLRNFGYKVLVCGREITCGYDGKCG